MVLWMASFSMAAIRTLFIPMSMLKEDFRMTIICSGELEFVFQKIDYKNGSTLSNFI